MNLHRRVGIVLIALSIVLSAGSLLLSTGWSSGVDLLPTIAVLLKLQLFGEDIPTKYTLLACLGLFAVGILYLLGVFSSTVNRTAKENDK